MPRDFSGREVLDLVSVADAGGARHLRGDLESAFGIRVREYPDRYMLTYGQTASAQVRFEPVVRVCRQLIVAKDLSRILHRSFDRFYNLGEDPDSASFDFARAVCEEKLDGALVGLYHDGEGWRHCSKSLAYAEGNLNASLKYRTFGELIDSEVDMRPVFEHGNRSLSYIFELTSQWDPHVTRYQGTQMHLLAVRDKDSGEYLDADEEARRLGWPWRPRVFRFVSRAEIVANARALPKSEEGYVCRIGSWRLKVKSPAHVAAERLKDATAKSESSVVQIVHACEDAEYLSCFPEDRELFAPWIAVRDAMPAWFGRQFLELRTDDRAEFALGIRQAGIPPVLAAVLFRLFETGGDFKAAMDGMDLKDSMAIKLYRAMRERLGKI